MASQAVEGAETGIVLCQEGIAVKEKQFINGETLEESTVYDLILTAIDNGYFDLDSTANDIQISVVLAKE